MSRGQAHKTRKVNDEKYINEVYLLSIRNDKATRVNAVKLAAAMSINQDMSLTYSLREKGLNRWIKERDSTLLPQVSTRHGAPMGRTNAALDYSEPNSIKLFKVVLDAGGYDNGGAYWGKGNPLWCAKQGAAMAFVRAHSRLQAVAYLEIPWRCLALPPVQQYKWLKEVVEAGKPTATQLYIFNEIEELRVS